MDLNKKIDVVALVDENDRLKQERDALVRYIRVRSGKRIEGDIGDNDDYRSAYMAIPEATRKEIES